MNCIFAGINLYENDNFNIQKNSIIDIDLSYKKQSRIHTTNMMMLKLKKHFNKEQIVKILNLYFNFVEFKCCNLNGLKRYLLLASATFLVNRDMTFIFNVFPEIKCTLKNFYLIFVYAILVNNTFTFYDNASNMLAFRSA